MIKRNFKAALLAASAMLVAVSAQATVTVNQLDLTTDATGTDTGTINGAIFTVTFQQPTGTGVIDPFLRVQNQGTEQGYNTSGGTPFDDKAGIFTHDLLYSSLQHCAVTINGTQYYQFLLDVNEPASAKLITLDNLQIYTSATGSQTTTNVSSLGTPVYSLDTVNAKGTGGTDNSVLIDALRNHGSGSGDVLISVPVSNFAGTLSTDYVYLYALFGAADVMASGGFEEFAVVCNVTPVPELSSFFPIVGLMAAVFATTFLRKRRMAQISV